MAAPETFTRRQGAVRARLHPRCGPEEYAAWLADPGSLAPTDAGPRWRGGSPSIKDPRWFVKRRTGRKGRRALEHSLDVGLALEDAGIAACLPLAVVRTGGVTWLVSEWLDGRDLDHALAEADADGRLELARRAGELVAELHAAGFRQRDLKAPNLLVVEGGAVDEAREVLAASPYRDEPSMRDLFPVEGGAPGAAAAQPAVYGADLFYTHGRLGDLFLEQALLQVEAGDRAAAERTLAQALYVSSDAIERAGLAHTFLARTPGTKAEKRRDLVRYLDAASLSRANLKHPRRMGDAARELLKQSGGDATKARELLTELIADKPLLRDPLGAALDGVLTLRAGR